MHLLLIHQNFPGQFRDLGPAWLQQGHQVTALGSAQAPTDSRRWGGLTYLRYELPGDDNPSVLARGQAVAAACQQLQRNGTTPDIVLVHSGWGEASNLRDVFPRTPLVVFPELWGHPQALGYGFDHHLEGQTANPLWFEQQNQLSADAIQASDAAVVSCEAQAQSFPVHLQAQLTVVPEGLELERYGSNPSASVSLHGQRFAAGDPLVTVVSRALEPLRGIRQSLLAWPSIVRAVPDAQLLLIGEPGQSYGMEVPPDGHTHLSASLAGLPEDTDQSRIHRLGWLEHATMVQLLQCSACHLGLSYPYTLSWSVLEAMACAAPLITNHGSPVATELIDGQSGVLVPFNNVERLAEAAIALLRNPPQRHQLGGQARAVIETRFSRSTSLASFSQLFNQLTQP